MSMAVEFLYLFYSLASAVVFIAMSALAGTALRSSKTQVSTHTDQKRFCVSKPQSDSYFYSIFLTGCCRHDDSSNGNAGGVKRTWWKTNPAAGRDRKQPMKSFSLSECFSIENQCCIREHSVLFPQTYILYYVYMHITANIRCL